MTTFLFPKVFYISKKIEKFFLDPRKKITLIPLFYALCMLLLIHSLTFPFSCTITLKFDEPKSFWCKILLSCVMILFCPKNWLKKYIINSVFMVRPVIFGSMAKLPPPPHMIRVLKTEACHTCFFMK